MEDRLVEEWLVDEEIQYEIPRTDVGDDGPSLGEDELTAMALAADPSDPVDEDAVPLAVYLGTLAQGSGLLPQWYMPTPMARSRKGWRLPVVLVIVASFVIIEALGLCSVFGQISVG